MPFVKKTFPDAIQTDAEGRIGKILGGCIDAFAVLPAAHGGIDKINIRSVRAVQRRLEDAAVVIQIGVAQLDLGIVLVEAIEFLFQSFKIVVMTDDVD